MEIEVAAWQMWKMAEGNEERVVQVERWLPYESA
jgi:hypothetical protein